MAPTPGSSDAASHAEAADETAATGSGLFILTLCRLAVPIAVPQPEASHLKRFTFFTSRARHPSGDARYWLHMGFFATLAEAQQCSKLLVRTYPNAIAGAAPAALLRERGIRVPTLQPARMTAQAPAPALPDLPPPEESPLTGVQALQILEQRDRADGQSRRAETHNGETSVSGQNAAVSFAVQLHWSVQPIDLTKVPPLSIFSALTLYVAQCRRDGRSWHSLRLGFFKEAIAAKQVGHYVRSSFSSVAVVPVSEQERARASANPIQFSAAQPEKASVTAPRPAQARKSSARKAQPVRAPARRGEDTLEQTLEELSASALLTSDDTLSDTGVRHLSIAVKK